MGHGGAYYWKGKVPAAQFFAGVPFGFTADEINAWVYRGGGLELWEEIYQPLTLNPYQEAIPARRCLDGLIRKSTHLQI